MVEQKDEILLTIAGRCVPVGVYPSRQALAACHSEHVQLRWTLVKAETPE